MEHTEEIKKLLSDWEIIKQTKRRLRSPEQNKRHQELKNYRALQCIKRKYEEHKKKVNSMYHTQKENGTYKKKVVDPDYIATYYRNNREYFRERQIEYYKLHRDEIRERLRLRKINNATHTFKEEEEEVN